MNEKRICMEKVIRMKKKRLYDIKKLNPKRIHIQRGLKSK